MKHFKFFGICLGLLFLIASAANAAGTVVQSASMVQNDIRQVTFTCTGDASDGSIPNTDTNTAITGYIKGFYLYKVEAFPTDGGTAPDAADVLIYDSDGLDLLGSEDGSTAYAGLGLIHATLKRSCLPNMHLPRADLHVNFYPSINGALTLDVVNQATASAEYTIVLTFVK